MTTYCKSTTFRPDFNVEIWSKVCRISSLTEIDVGIWLEAGWNQVDFLVSCNLSNLGRNLVDLSYRPRITVISTIDLVYRVLHELNFEWF